MSKQKLTLLFAVPIFALIMICTACEHSGGVAVYVRTPPPPPLAETIVVAPGPGYFWVPGYQSWNGNRYVWVPGHYERAPYGRHVWVPGRWVHNGHGWYWREGHWR
jgi:WXXGXW repeat (2 copies)